MATYDLTSSIPTKVAAGDILNCPYSGTYKTITLPKGAYKLECWGAQGGNYQNTSYQGGNGGYSVGILTLSSEVNAFLTTGGVGGSPGTSGSNGGYNGGGSTSSSGNYGAGGGGASDIRIGQNSLYARIIVAGGGGGCGYSTTNKTVGYGGGTSGGTGAYYSGYGPGYGGTQTTGGNSTSSSNMTTVRASGFGVGASSSSTSASGGWTGGGGGSGWYGGGHGGAISSGGGGSGYVYTASTASNYPSGCLLDSSMYLTDASTIAGNASMPSTLGSTEIGHAGNGYVRITVIKVGSIPIRTKVNGNIVEATGGFVKVSGAWKEISSIHIKKDGEWISN